MPTQYSDLPQDTSPEARKATELATGLRDIADMIEANPRYMELFRYGAFNMINVFPDDMDAMRDLVRTALKHGATVDKNATGDTWFAAILKFGCVQIHANMHRDEVCERVVTGTREVTEEIPDPEKLAAVPTVTRTRTEEVIEWKCRPLLADTQEVST